MEMLTVRAAFDKKERKIFDEMFSISKEYVTIINF